MRDHLLNIGVRMLARDGVANVSLRQITSAAKVNTALMHYYFGSKTGFFDAVVARCIKPINDERLRQLEKAERNGKAPALSEVIWAWAAPLLIREQATHQPALILRLYADIAAQANPEIRKATEDYSREAVARFVAAFRKALPKVNKDEAAWRFFYLVSILRTSCSDPYFLERITNGRWSVHDSDAFLKRLVSSLAKTLGAPA